jgi:cytochrome c553
MINFKLSRVLVLMFFVTALAFVGYAKYAESACGASATNCKSCHEVKGEKKVNDGAPQHKQHAFGDFCVFCHGGNTAGKTMEEAHEGMASPLADPKKSCSACHPDDFEKRAGKYQSASK